jgi:hypothetical protein
MHIHLLSSHPARGAVFAAAAVAAAMMLSACASTSPSEPASRPPADAAPESRTVQGYRVQIFQTEDKAEADRHLSDALTWWSSQPEVAVSPLPADLPVYTVFRAPYYRLRVGDFATQASAEQALGVLKPKFPDAFVVPDTVTLGP